VVLAPVVEAVVPIQEMHLAVVVMVQVVLSSLHIPHKYLKT
tara:strand:+ start:193 stop:315 length:123 start_codon:yes stop_codon:yes gene_type:complete